MAIEDGVREWAQNWREVLLGLKSPRPRPGAAAGGRGWGAGFRAALEEIFPGTRVQRCWVHNTANILNYLPRSLQPKAKGMLHEIWMAPTQARARSAFDRFLETYEGKYPKTADCLRRDREALLAFYDFPAEHWCTCGRRTRSSRRSRPSATGAIRREDA